MARCKTRRRKSKSMKLLLSREMNISRRKVFIGTQTLTPVTRTQMDEFLWYDMVDKLTWAKNVFECDSFAILLLGSAKRYFAEKYGFNPSIGMVWTRDHAICFYVTPLFEIVYIEPQNDYEIDFPCRKVFALI